MKIKRNQKKTTLVKKVETLAKQVRQQKPELKWYEVNSIGTNVTYAGIIASLNDGISQGTADFGNRIGDEILMKSLRVRLKLSTNGSSVPTIFRVIFFLHKNNADGTISDASILNLLLHSAQMSSTNAPFTPYDHDNRSSFKVLSDRMYTANIPNGSVTALTASSVLKTISKTIKLNDKVKYFAAATTPTKNELFMVVLTDTATNSVVAYNTCLYYTDS